MSNLKPKHTPQPRRGKPNELTSDLAAYNAASALKSFHRLTRSPQESIVGDLLTDLMHWCVFMNHDFDAALARAKYHFEAEHKARNSSGG